MPVSETNISDHSGSLLESHKGYDPRIIVFYFLLAAMLLTLAGGLAYQQLSQTETYNERERVQSQRRVVLPGPRGNLYARDGVTLLVGNRPRFSVVLYLDELKPDFLNEAKVIRRNYGKSDIPKSAIRDIPFSRIARVSVVQRYLDEVNKIIDRSETVNGGTLTRHFEEQLLLPYTLIDDLSENEYARLIESLPVRSPLQVYTSSTRHYPYGSAAAHALGYIGVHDDVSVDDFPGDDLHTFKLKGTIGKDGLEKTFDEHLQGEPGGTIFRVDPSGYKVNPPLAKRLPVQGKSIVTSLDLDLQLTAEESIGDQVGSAVAIEVKTGEVLALTSKPDYALSKMSPRISEETWKDIIDRNALTNHAIGGAYPPGSTFKILVSIAALRSGAIAPEDVISNCAGTLRIGNYVKGCDNGHAHHGETKLSEAIAVSCDIYYYTLGLKMGAEAIAAEARRFHLHERTGINLPAETSRMLIPDAEWKLRTRNEKWFPGDTANMAIGQGDVLVTPLEMACFAASVARDEVYTKPTLLHDPEGKPQHTERIGLTPAQRAALIAGMVGCTTPAFETSTARNLASPLYRIPGISVAGKTGTAQKRVKIGDKVGTINFAWFICFAPADNPEIAVAVMLEGDTIGESFGGGANAGPVANVILKKYFEKKNRPASPAFQPFKLN